MRKGERTKEHVVKVAAGVMNRHGWLSTPVQAITQATGLTKGGLYNHFDSLRSLSEQAFSYATRRLIAMVDQHTTMPGSAEARLLALLAAFDWVAGRKPPFDAGCPLLNAAIEIDVVEVKHVLPLPERICIGVASTPCNVHSRIVGPEADAAADP